MFNVKVNVIYIEKVCFKVFCFCDEILRLLKLNCIWFCLYREIIVFVLLFMFVFLNYFVSWWIGRLKFRIFI